MSYILTSDEDFYEIPIWSQPIKAEVVKISKMAMKSVCFLWTFAFVGNKRKTIA